MKRIEIIFHFPNKIKTIYKCIQILKWCWNFDEPSHINCAEWNSSKNRNYQIKIQASSEWAP